MDDKPSIEEIDPALALFLEQRGVTFSDDIATIGEKIALNFTRATVTAAIQGEPTETSEIITAARASRWVPANADPEDVMEAIRYLRYSRRVTSKKWLAHARY